MAGTKLTFKDWLAQQGAEDSGEADRTRTVEEWADDSSRLYADIIRWLAADDADRLLKVSSNKIPREEQGLGRYEVPTLSIHLRNRVVDLIPVARNVVGSTGTRGDLGVRAEGRVDMTNGADKYMLYRAIYPAGPRWVIVDDDTYTVRDLDKDAFEAALQDLLS